MRTIGVSTITQPMAMMVSGRYCKWAAAATTATPLRGGSLKIIIITVVLGRVKGLAVSKCALCWSSER